MKRLLLLGLALGACTDGAAPEPADAAVPETWATYRIAPGAHSADLENREPRNPIDGVVDVTGRDYELALDVTAMYVLTAPAQPQDQLDWNKLPGLSDCGEIDLAADGAMFGWRWRVDLSPPVLEVTAYANNAGTHLSVEPPLLTLDADDLTSATPLRYRVARGIDRYVFSVEGSVRGRAIEASATLPRRCNEMPRDPLAWAGAFYFGGTSVAPHLITAQMRERTYAD
ncbi:MAG: hypothetical protein ABI867_22140 [Kofleriaceae bacterium]